MLKRAFDVVVALAGIVMLFPLLLAVAVAVRLVLGKPVFFRQVRPGINGEPFTILKFRTMHDWVDDNGMPLPDDVRLTRFGRFLRSTSLDELPELWNVLRGDMSLVGPRPLRMEYLPLYTEEQARRHRMKPGLTGWAQVNGRNSLTWEEKFALDIWYCDNWSFRLDIKILLLTVLRVLKREGITAGTDVTMPRFEGSPPRGQGANMVDAQKPYDG